MVELLAWVSLTAIFVILADAYDKPLLVIGAFLAASGVGWCIGKAVNAGVQLYYIGGN